MMNNEVSKIIISIMITAILTREWLNSNNNIYKKIVKQSLYRSGQP